jgi:uncharacterized protein (TIGR02147 family)
MIEGLLQLLAIDLYPLAAEQYESLGAGEQLSALVLCEHLTVQGQRNLTRDKAPDLARALKLDDRESEYFQLLVELTETTGHAAQRALLQKIESTFKDGLFSSIPDDGIEIFRDWYYPAIREIVTLTDAQPTSAWIAARLGIEVEQVEEALDVLVARGYLKDEGGQLVRAEPSVRTSRNKVYPMMLGAYHMKMLEQAFAALSLTRDRRHFEGLTFALPRRLMPQIKEMIQRFFREVDMLVEAQEGREEVCHLRVELFPLTRWTDPKGPP